jgi:hypothetical protein
MKNDISYKYSCDYINYNNKNKFNKIYLKDNKKYQINKELFYKPQNSINLIQKKYIINKKSHNKFENKPVSLEINTKSSKNSKSFINYSLNNNNDNSHYLIQSKPKIYLKDEQQYSNKPLNVILVNNKSLINNNNNNNKRPYTALKLKNKKIDLFNSNLKKNIKKKEKIKSLNLPTNLDLNSFYYNFNNNNLNDNSFKHSFLNNNNYNKIKSSVNKTFNNSENYVFKLIEFLLEKKQEELKLNQNQHFKNLKKDIIKNEEKVKHIMDSLKRFQRNSDEDLKSKGYIYKFIKERKKSDSFRYIEN